MSTVETRRRADIKAKELIETWMRERDIRYFANDCAPTWPDLQDLVYRIGAAIAEAGDKKPRSSGER